MSHCFKDFDFDLGPEFKDFVSGAKETIREFGERLRDGGGVPPFFGYDPFCNENGRPHRPDGGPSARESCGQTFYGFPPLTSYKDASGALVMKFALAGVEESSVKTAFQGDYLVLSARFPDDGEDGLQYRRRGYRPRSVDRQKYFVPSDDYDQSKASAQLKAGLLTVIMPAKEFPEADTIRVTIVKEGS